MKIIIVVQIIKTLYILGLGWALYNCSSGYILDPSIGALYICDNGIWSTKPRCLSTIDLTLVLPSSPHLSLSLKGTGRCSLSTLTTLLSMTTGLQSTGQTQLMRAPDDSTVILNGSYIVFSCMNGYTNMGGNLNVTCNANGTWSPFPKCVRGSNGGPMSSSIVNSTSARCSVTSTTFFIPYGFLVNTTAIILYEDGTASGVLMSLTGLHILFSIF